MVKPLKRVTARSEALKTRWQRRVNGKMARLMLDSAELMQTSMESSHDFIERIVDEYTKNKQFFAKAREEYSKTARR